MAGFGVGCCLRGMGGSGGCESESESESGFGVWGLEGILAQWLGKLAVREGIEELAEGPFR